MARNMWPVLRERQATGCCPSCGQKVPEAGLRVDLQTNTVSANGMIVKVQPRTAELLEVLLAAYPNFVPRETIIAKVWACDAQDRIVDAYATRARVHLAKIGWGIDSFRYSGYRLVDLSLKPEPSLVPTIASFSRLQYPAGFAKPVRVRENP